MNLAESSRPASLEAVVGQPKAVQLARQLIARGLGGRAVWISGPSGTGKTTLARILAAELADRWCVAELDAGDLTADRLRAIEDQQRLYGWGKGGRAWIINEAHGLRAESIRRLLVLLEAIPAHVVWIFTTTRDGEDKLFDDHADAGPLLSRCSLIPLSTYGFLRPAAESLKATAAAAGLDGLPLERYERLIRECRGNMRQALQSIECGAMAAKGGAP